MRRLCLVGLLVLACDSDSDDGAGDSGGSSGGSTSTSSATTGGETDPSTTTSSATTTSTGTSTSDASGTGSDGSTGSAEGTGTTGYAGPLVPRDCRTLLESDPNTPSGVHAVNVGGNPNADTVAVYCDMVTSGGGWTLIGRSAAGAAEVDFGWFHSTGSVQDDAAPYSLGIAAADLEFTELLWGSYTDGKTWGPDAFSATVPENFAWLYTDAPYYTSPTTVSGTCMPDGGPAAMRVIGFTERNGRFLFTDSPSDQIRGLEPALWDSQSDNCTTGGNLLGLGGMLFVR